MKYVNLPALAIMVLVGCLLWFDGAGIVTVILVELVVFALLCVLGVIPISANKQIDVSIQLDASQKISANHYSYLESHKRLAITYGNNISNWYVKAYVVLNDKRGTATLYVAENTLENIFLASACDMNIVMSGKTYPVTIMSDKKISGELISLLDESVES